MAQVLNQNAAWPNVAWTVGGVYTPAGLVNNPTVAANFTFDDDAAGNGSSDVIYVESPVTDLTAAHGVGETWNTVDSLMGAQQDAQADAWIKKYVDLSAYSGTIQIRFRAIGAGTFEGDISIDDIAINGCTSPFTVNLGPDSNACSTDTILLDAGAGNYSYAWSTGETTQTITVDTTSLGGNGIYNVYVTVTDTITGCFTTDTIVVNFSVCTGVNADVTNVDMHVYPNPTNGLFTLNINTNDVKELSVSIINLHGQVIYAKNNFNNISTVKEQIDLRDHANGIYFVQVTSDKGIVTHKVILQ